MLIFQKLSRRPYNILEMNINGFWVIYDIFLSIFVNLTVIEVAKETIIDTSDFLYSNYLHSYTNGMYQGRFFMLVRSAKIHENVSEMILKPFMTIHIHL